MTRHEALKAVKSYIMGSKRSNLALFIDGPWGTGKTHLIKEIIEARKAVNDNVIYVSLFSIDSLDDLRTKIVLDALPIRNGAVVTKFFSRIVATGSRIGEYYALLGLVLDALKLFVDHRTITNRTIVFDDYERTKINLGEILGLANELLEHLNNRVIFVGNSNEFAPEQKKAHDTHRSKVIGDVIQYQGDIRDVLEVYVAELDTSADSLRVEEQDAIVEHILHGTDKNIRNAIYAYNHIAWVVRNLKEACANNNVVLADEKWISLAGALAGISMAHRMSRFSDSDLAMLVEYPRMGLRRHTEAADESSELIRGTLSDYHIDLSDLELVGPHLPDLILSVSHDYDQICHHLLDYIATQVLTAESWMRIWHLDAVDDDAELQSLSEDLHNKWSIRHFHAPHEIMHVFCVMVFLSRKKVIDVSEESLIVDLERYLAEIELQLGDEEHRLDARSAYGLGYMLSADDVAKNAAESLINTCILSNLARVKGGAALALPHLIVTDQEAAMAMLEREHHDKGDELVAAFDAQLDIQKTTKAILEVKGRGRLILLYKFVNRYDSLRDVVFMQKATETMERIDAELVILKENAIQQRQPLKEERIAEMRAILLEKIKKIRENIIRVSAQVD